MIRPTTSVRQSAARMLTTLSTLAQATDDLTLRLARLLIGCSGGRGCPRGVAGRERRLVGYPVQPRGNQPPGATSQGHATTGSRTMNSSRGRNPLPQRPLNDAGNVRRQCLAGSVLDWQRGSSTIAFAAL